MDSFFGDLLAFLNANPWIWGLTAICFAVWVGSVVVVFRSRKFLRKWLWLLLTLVSFSFQWSIGPGETFGIGLPFGSLFILWYAAFGRGPTAEQVAADAERRSVNAAGQQGAGWRLWTLRAVYGVAALTTLVIGELMASGAMFDAFGPDFRKAFGPAILISFQIFTGVVVLGIGGLYAYLALRPWWWGKILLVWPGLSWTMFGAVGQLVLQPGPLVAVVLACGLIMLAAAAVAQVADPRFSGVYLRAGTAI